jgi:UDP:flavonoid glycosyltransferase YjiC (YdhE family)
VNILFCPMSDPGYLYPSIAVARELRRRGARVHVLARPGAAALLAEADLPFLPAEPYGGRQSFNVNEWFGRAPRQYRAIRDAAREVQADVLVTSLLCRGALLAAEALELPVVVIGLAAHLWAYQENGAVEPEFPARRAWRTREMLRNYNLAREQVGLPRRSAGAADYPLIGTALLLRGDPALEYPAAVLPERVHHVGPCTWEPRAEPEELAAVLDRLDRVDKPVVYVHLARIFDGTSPWPRLNAAFTDGPFQAVVELGRSDDPRPAPDADLVVVRKPWMGPLLDRAEFVLTTCTSAPVLNALLRGRALGVSPDGSEQSLLAEACVRAGVAAYVPNELSPDPVKVLRSAADDSGLREQAGELGRRLAAADGGGRAADIIQRVVTGTPPRATAPTHVPVNSATAESVVD